MRFEKIQPQESRQRWAAATATSTAKYICATRFSSSILMTEKINIDGLEYTIEFEMIAGYMLKSVKTGHLVYKDYLTVKFAREKRK